MCEQLRISAPEIEPIFIALKDGKDSNLLEPLSPQEISSLIKAFTLPFAIKTALMSVTD